MNYHHSYHAGNFADVIKHIVLCLLLERLAEKPTPFSFLDTHAGAGYYSLLSEEAQKKCEYEEGILNLFNARTAEIPPAISRYLETVHAHNPMAELAYYPGSPIVAASMMRSIDSMILCELHPAEKEYLQKNKRLLHTKTAIHHVDGYLGMKAFLPPKEARGLVLIDPPFEVTDEFSRILNALKLALHHWRSGQYLIWYPIKNERAVQSFEQSLRSLTKEILLLHMAKNQALPGKLSACGLAIINPPWKLEVTLKKEIFPYLSESLNAVFSLANG